jgi:hypothetical protein
MVLRLFGLVFALVALSACSASLDTSLDNKRCEFTHRCLPGVRDRGTLYSAVIRDEVPEDVTRSIDQLLATWPAR